MEQPLTRWGTPDFSDKRLIAGYLRQQATQSQALTSGARLVGYKIAANDKATQTRLGLSAPLLGFLTSNSALDNTDDISVRDAILPGVEGELAILLGDDLPLSPETDEIKRAIAGYSLAAEIIDVNRRYDDVEGLLTSNVFHRAFFIKEPSAPPVSVDLMTTWLSISVNGSIAWALPIGFVLGDPLDAVHLAAKTLAASGNSLQAGQIILSGVLHPLPVWVRAGDVVDVDGGALGQLILSFKNETKIL